MFTLRLSFIFGVPAALILAIYLSSRVKRYRFDGCCPLTNWECRFQFSALSIVRPTSLREIVDAVNRARERGQTVRLVGMGHSYADIAVPDAAAANSMSDAGHQSRSNGSVLVCMHCYAGLVGLNKTTGLLTILGGTTLNQIIGILNDNQLAVSVIPTITDSTIAGALATGTHGQGIGHGNLASLVREIEIVLASGEVVTAGPDENSDVFYAGVVGLGALGIVTKVTLQTVPAFNLLERTAVLPSADVLEKLAVFMAAEEYVKLVFDVHTRKMAVFTCSRTDQKPRDNPSQLAIDMKSQAMEILQYTTSYIPSVIPAMMDVLVNNLGVLPSGERVDSWHRILKILYYVPLHLEAEFAVPAESAPAAMEDIFSFVREINIGINMFNEVRCVASDQFWLSNAHNQTVCHLTLLLYGQDHRRHEYLGDIGHMLFKKYGARPHWAKFYTLSEPELRTVYPKWDDFVALKRKLDPTKMFCNDYLRRLFSESNAC